MVHGDQSNKWQRITKLTEINQEDDDEIFESIQKNIRHRLEQGNGNLRASIVEEEKEAVQKQQQPAAEKESAIDLLAKWNELSKNRTSILMPG